MATIEKEKLSYESTVELPSRGLLYKDCPSEITMRGMTVKEEKILFASSGGDVFKKILASCIVSPKNFDVNALVAGDEIYLIMQLRKLTYGSEYTIQGDCPECGARETFTINLDDFDVKYLDSDFKEPMEVKLPRSGDTLSLKLLRNSDSEFVSKQARKFAKQFNQNARELEYSMRMAKSITAINGESVTFEDARAYVDNMMSMDSRVMQSALNKVVFGYDTEVSVTCSNCGEEYEFQMPLNSEFFRPKY